MLASREMGPDPLALRQMEDLVLAMFEDFHDFTGLFAGLGGPGGRGGSGGALMGVGPSGMRGMGIGMTSLMIPDLREDLMNLETLIAGGRVPYSFPFVMTIILLISFNRTWIWWRNDDGRIGY
jgi:hypothetical protein